MLIQPRRRKDITVLVFDLTILCNQFSEDKVVRMIYFQKLHFIISKKSIHQVLDYWDVSIIGSHIVHDYTLLPYGICCLLQPKYTKLGPDQVS